MNISHVIRGDDHVNNTPRQVPLFEALGFAVPQFAHLPMILGSDKAQTVKTAWGDVSLGLSGNGVFA